ncbi:MAG TPA: hypothetical protein VJN44_06460 [Roseateles sp.]|nr:hypothetical protein [Roseateles sp.]
MSSTRVLALLALAAAQLPALAAGFSAGIELREQATAADVGLPAYPGARPQHKAGDRAEDKAALRLDLWGGAFGFRLVVAKFAADEELERVASFYRAALAQFGPVLDCSAPPAAAGAKPADPTRLSCGDDRPGPGGLLYKAGTPQRQRVVSLQPVGAGSTHFQLVLVETKQP